MKKLISLSTLLIFLLMACSKEADTTDPVVKIDTPAYGQILKKGGTISIQATAKDENLKGISLVVFDPDGNGTLISKEFDANGKSDFTVNETWVANIKGDSSRVSFAVSASDKSGNVAFDNKTFTIKK